MNTGTKAVLLVVGAYPATLVVCALATLTVVALMDLSDCGSATRALAVLLTTMAALFLASVVVVGIVARKMVEHVAGCLAIVAVYLVVMLASYVAVGFGLLVAFNC